MIVRRLAAEEHYRTRPLYEAVFTEDEKAFVDYYYEWKTRNNQIYVAEDEEGIHAMVHLNPFRMYVQGEIHTLHYIVAVATQEEYRHRGLMRSLLALAEREMEAAGECFTFLMPASEKIYAPFGYRYFCTQRRGVLRAAGTKEAAGGKLRAAAMEEAAGGMLRAAAMEEAAEGKLRATAMEEAAGGKLRAAGTKEAAGDKLRAAAMEETAGDRRRASQGVCRPVQPEEYDRLASFVNEVLKDQYDVFVYRDALYYERLQAEQRCQNGDVMVIVDADGNLIGTFCTSQELSDAPDSVAVQTAKNGAITGTPDKRCVQAYELREVILDPDQYEAGTDALRAFAGARGCKVLGCQAELVLSEVQEVPLLMGKRPDGTVFCSEYDAKKVFINEVV